MHVNCAYCERRVPHLIPVVGQDLRDPCVAPRKAQREAGSRHHSFWQRWSEDPSILRVCPRNEARSHFPAGCVNSNLMSQEGKSAGPHVEARCIPKLVNRAVEDNVRVEKADEPARKIPIRVAKCVGKSAPGWHQPYGRHPSRGEGGRCQHCPGARASCSSQRLREGVAAHRSGRGRVPQDQACHLGLKAKRKHHSQRQETAAGARRPSSAVPSSRGRHMPPTEESPQASPPLVPTLRHLAHPGRRDRSGRLLLFPWAAAGDTFDRSAVPIRSLLGHGRGSRSSRGLRPPRGPPGPFRTVPSLPGTSPCSR
eukprot:scaffold172_cov254-Pinguiococcus_pyrenoidosus.AAC.19